jgi:hypothetical protein
MPTAIGFRRFELFDPPPPAPRRSSGSKNQGGRGFDKNHMDVIFGQR